MANLSRRPLDGDPVGRNVQAMGEARYHLFDTPEGPCALGWNTAGLTQVQLPEASLAETDALLARRSGGSPTDDLPAAIADCAARMRAYFGGAETDFADIALDMRGGQ